MRAKKIKHFLNYFLLGPPVFIILDRIISDVDISVQNSIPVFLSVLLGVFCSFVFCELLGEKLGKQLWVGSMIIGLGFLVIFLLIGADDLVYFDAMDFFLGFFLPASSYHRELTAWKTELENN